MSTTARLCILGALLGFILGFIIPVAPLIYWRCVK